MAVEMRCPAMSRGMGAPGRGVPEDGLRALASELAGRDLGPFFDRYVDGTDELPLAGLLARSGVRLAFRAAQGAKDRGGKRGNGEAPRSALGAVVGADLKLRHVFHGGAAERAGLAAGDELIAVNGWRVRRADDLPPAGALSGRAELLAARDQRLLALSLDTTDGERPAGAVQLAPMPAPEAAVATRRAAWLGTAAR